MGLSLKLPNGAGDSLVSLYSDSLIRLPHVIDPLGVSVLSGKIIAIENRGLDFADVPLFELQFRLMEKVKESRMAQWCVA